MVRDGSGACHAGVQAAGVYLVTHEIVSQLPRIGTFETGRLRPLRNTSAGACDQ
jgi:hypothetical protein